MLPRLVVRVRRVVRHLRVRTGNEPDLSGAENRARWHAMLSGIEARDRANERRLAEAERALNRLNRT